MNKRHYEHTLPNIRGSLSNTYLDFVWQLCFMVKYCQDTRKLSMQKSMAAATRRQAIRYRNLKNPLKHTMATAAHTGDMPRVYI